MRILHTADWHLGQRFHDQRRAGDEAHALDQLVELARERRVDAVLVAGDIFDTANPGAEEQERYYRCLQRWVSEAGVATVVLTAGNHDSALRLDGPRALLRGLGIHVVGRWPRDADPERCLVPLRDRQGRVGAVCAAVPYLRDGDLRLARAGESQAEIHERYARALESRYAQALEAARNRADELAESGALPVVVMGHCYVTGAQAGGGERPVQIGNLARADARALAGGADYLALGHLHRPQSVGGRPHWRYCGSLLPTGFDEVERRREVVLVELGGTGSDGETGAEPERIPLEPYRRYLRLAGTPAELEAQIDALPAPGAGLASGDSSSDANNSDRGEGNEGTPAPEPTPWCEAAVYLDGPRPGIARELSDRCRERGWSLISVRRERPPGTEPGEDGDPGDPDVRQLEELDPEEVFVAKHVRDFDTEPTDALRAEFLRLLEIVRAGGDGSELDPARTLDPARPDAQPDGTA